MRQEILILPKNIERGKDRNVTLLKGWTKSQLKGQELLFVHCSFSDRLDSSRTQSTAHYCVVVSLLLPHSKLSIDADDALRALWPKSTARCLLNELIWSLKVHSYGLSLTRTKPLLTSINYIQIAWSRKLYELQKYLLQISQWAMCFKIFKRKKIRNFGRKINRWL